MGEFIGKRIVPRHEGDWDRNRSYEPLMIVLDPESGDGYISRYDVPAGTELSNTHYWALCSHFHAQMHRLETDLDADVKGMHQDLAETKQAMSEELDQTQSDMHEDLQQTKTEMSKEMADTHAAITQELGDTHAAISQELKDTHTAISQELSETHTAMSTELKETETQLTAQTNRATEAMNDARTSMNSAVANMTQRLDANVTARTTANKDYAAEVVDGRVSANGKTYPSLGGHIRDLDLARDMLNILAGWPITHGYANEKGTITPSDFWICAYMIPVNSERIILDGHFSCMSGSPDYYNVVCYDKNMKMIGGVWRTEPGEEKLSNKEIMLLEGTQYVSISSGGDAIEKYGWALYQPVATPDQSYRYSIGGEWEWANGRYEIVRTDTSVAVTFPSDCYLCRCMPGGEYRQNMVNENDNVEVEIETNLKWWGIYYQQPTEEGEQAIHIEIFKYQEWQKMFIPDRFILAIFYGSRLAYIPSAGVDGGILVNGVECGSIYQFGKFTSDIKKYLTKTLFLTSGAISIDREAWTIQVSKRILGTSDVKDFQWIEAQEEPIPITEVPVRTNMLMLAYNATTKNVNLYTTAQFRDLGYNGYYIASLYQGTLYNPHMTTDFEIILDGVSKKAGEIFFTENEKYVEKKYIAKISEAEDRMHQFNGGCMYLASGKLEINTEESTVRIVERTLSAADNEQYFWLFEQEEPVSYKTTDTSMKILAADVRDYRAPVINIYTTKEFRALKQYGYYIAAWYGNRLYNANINPSYKIVLNGEEKSAGELFFEEGNNSFVERRYRNHVQTALTEFKTGLEGDFKTGIKQEVVQEVKQDVKKEIKDELQAEAEASKVVEDDMGDIVSPSHWDCFEGRQFSMFFDCLTRNEGRDGLYRVTNNKNLTRNEYCLNYTPKAEDTDFTVNVVRLDRDTLLAAETKSVKVSMFAAADGSVKPGKRGAFNAGRIRFTQADIEAAPEYLPFQRGLYDAIVESGSIEGENITFHTRFGMDFQCRGVNRKLAAFLGYRKCDEDGIISLMTDGTVNSYAQIHSQASVKYAVRQ